MGERMTEDDLVAAWDDGRRGEIWDELVRARESEERLVEALEAVKSWRGSGEHPLERFERIGDMFTRDTGFLRPGKSASLEMGRYDEEDRHRAWIKWAERKNDELDRQIVKALSAAGVEAKHG